MQKMTEAQRRVMRWVGKGWRAQPGAGSAIIVNGRRICNVDTMMVLYRRGLVSKDEQGCWSATPSGRTITSELAL